MFQFYSSKVPKKGKGAKGFQVIESLGKPVVNADGVAESFDYSFLSGAALMETLKMLVDFIEQHRKLSSRATLESCVRGIDNSLRSVTIREEMAVSELSQWILEQDLAEDEKSSKELASLWNQTQEFQKKCNVLVNSKEDFAIGRKVYVDGLKAAGVWKIRLVNPEATPTTNPVVSPETPVVPAQ